MGDRLQYIGKGQTFNAFREGASVVKVSRPFPTQTEAEQKLQQYEGEYRRVRTYLGDYAQESTFSIERDEQWVVKVHQPPVEGTPLRQSLKDNNPEIQGLFRKSLEQYAATRSLPDLYPDLMFDPTLGIYLTGRYSYKAGPNVLVTGQGFPVLVDVTLTPLLRGKLIAPIANFLLAQRLKSLLR